MVIGSLDCRVSNGLRTSLLKVACRIIANFVSISSKDDVQHFTKITKIMGTFMHTSFGKFLHNMLCMHSYSCNVSLCWNIKVTRYLKEYVFYVKYIYSY